MKVTGFLAAATMLAFHPCFGQSVLKLPCGDKDEKCARKAMRNHVVSKLDTWQATLAVPVSERIGPASPQLVEYINLDNIKNGFPERPRAAKLDAGLLADVKAAVADLPPKIWDLFGERLLGLYFVEDLGGTGYTDYVLDQNGKPVAAYSVFDAAILTQKNANAWATWKENTPFKDGAGYKLHARIETDSNDNRKNAIQYVLLHELGHVLSVGSHIHPPWNIRPNEIEKGAEYPFFNLSWRIDPEAGKYQSIFDAAFPQRLSTRYYFGAKLSATDMVPTYINLENTSFASLYAATNPFDDFAESFVTYVHVVLMNRPWQIEIRRDGEVVHTVKPCWGEPRCAKKKEILDRILTRSS